MAGRGGGFLGMAANRPLPDGMGFELGDIKGMLTCPYHESHVVGSGKYASHVNACRMAAPEEKKKRFIVCVFNATHHVKRELMSDHMRICPDRAAASVGVIDLSAEFYSDLSAPREVDDVEKEEEATLDDEGFATTSVEGRVDGELQEDVEPGPSGLDKEKLELQEDVEPGPSCLDKEKLELQEDVEPGHSCPGKEKVKLQEDVAPGPSGLDKEKLEMQEDVEPGQSDQGKEKVKESEVRWGPLRKHSMDLLQVGVASDKSPWVTYTWYTGRGRGSEKLWKGFGDEPKSTESRRKHDTPTVSF